MRDLGIFTPYKPVINEGEPHWTGVTGEVLQKIIFLRNEQGQDFYELVRLQNPPRNETYLTVFPSTNRVMTAQNDMGDVFPADVRLVAIDRVANPSTLVNKILNADGTLSDPPARAPIVPMEADGLIGALQAEGIITAAKATALRTRLRR